MPVVRGYQWSKNNFAYISRQYPNSISVSYLQACWKDSVFDPKQRAFYYVCVIDIPTPRWTTYDVKFFGTKIPEGAQTSIQDLAYTTPIWYSL